jgi:hypothetical protein
VIHTLTLNTAIDMNIFCDPLQPAAVNRTRQTEYCPNGKGLTSRWYYIITSSQPMLWAYSAVYRPLYR